MFTATDVLNAEFVEQPLNKLWSLISPLYMVDESQWLEQLLPLATPTADEKAQMSTKTTELIEASLRRSSPLLRDDPEALQILGLQPKLNVTVTDIDRTATN